jgi:hypothetical protein
MKMMQPTSRRRSCCDHNDASIKINNRVSRIYQIEEAIAGDFRIEASNTSLHFMKQVYR